MSNNNAKKDIIETRIRNALWGFFAGDALASPTHWYYGGNRQIQSDYGPAGITDYTKPVFHLQGSILNKSNVNGGGRGSFKSKEIKTIIGDVINHDKLQYWDPTKSIHYHATLNSGENTLEAQLARVLMKSIVSNNGKFNADHFRNEYIKFMTTPNSHNDTYASTCHRMFFANLIFNNKPPKDCPDNDHHNVDTIDGLVLPTITALAMSGSGAGEDEVARFASQTASVTRQSKVLENYSAVWGKLIYNAVHDDDETTNNEKNDNDDMFVTHINNAALSLGLRTKPSKNKPDTMTACYLSSSVPSTLDMIAKYTTSTTSNKNNMGVWNGLLANANVGGENVHRGSILGAVLGARSSSPVTPKLRNGLYDYNNLSKEIDNFINAIMNNNNNEKDDKRCDSDNTSTS